MFDATFLEIHHDEALALFILLRSQEEKLSDDLQSVLLKLERRLFAVHSIEEMEALIKNAGIDERKR